ncbi:hypothetical protein BH23CHL9_BH23CHL9_05810 [soil metagenome]
MAKRRTSGIQRRERASEEALNRRIDAPSGMALPDWRLLAIGGVLVVGVIILALVILFGSGPSETAGTQQANDGSEHVPPGTTCRSAAAPCGPDPYSSTPGTSGPHWDPSALANWGAYTTPQNESQVIHNLEHGGIVIWYDPERVDTDGVSELTSYVNRQVSAGISGRFKFILSPWAGEDELPAPIAVTAWRQLLELDEVDTGALDTFSREHYGLAPEPNGGPGPPG